MMHVWCYFEFRITNMKFALVTRGLITSKEILSGILDKQFSS